MKPSTRHALEQEVRAVMEARRDLGPQYADVLTDKIMRLVDDEVQARVQAQPEIRRDVFPDEEERWGRRPFRHRRHSGIVSQIMPVLGVSIPLVAIAGGIAHTPGILAVFGLDAVAIWSIAHSSRKT